MNPKLYRPEPSTKKEQVFHSERLYAPEIGSLFTSKLCPPKKDGGDFTIRNIPSHTGYVKENIRDRTLELEEGRYYRFIVSAVHQKNGHNYFFAVPFRKLTRKESRKYNWLDPGTFLKIKRLAESLVGNL